MTASSWFRLCPPLYFAVSVLIGLGLHHAFGKPLLLLAVVGLLTGNGARNTNGGL